MTRISAPTEDPALRFMTHARPENGQNSASGHTSIFWAVLHMMPKVFLLGRSVEVGSVDSMTLMSEYFVKIYSMSLGLSHSTLGYKDSSKGA